MKTQKKNLFNASIPASGGCTTCLAQFGLWHHNSSFCFRCHTTYSLCAVSKFLSSNKNTNHTGYSNPVWPHLNVITSVKLFPNKVIFTGFRWTWTNFWRMLFNPVAGGEYFQACHQCHLFAQGLVAKSAHRTWMLVILLSLMKWNHGIEI
jgi:hypothetical protein